MISRQTAVRKFLAVAALLGLLLGIYCLAIRPRQLQWGATPEELARPLPGDDLISDPTFYATRAVTIAGHPEQIWPWIVQIGWRRAGFYGYDLIENIGSPRGIRSAQRIIPELQSLAPGDRVYMSAVAYLVIHSMVRNKFLIWEADEHPPSSAFTWALFPVDAYRTRLILRVRLKYLWTRSWIFLDLFTEFADHVAVPKMLLGIADRVEGRPIEPLWVQGAEIAVWLVAFLEFAVGVVLVFVAQRWWRAWIVALLAGLILLFVLYARAPAWTEVLLLAAIMAAMFWSCQSVKPYQVRGEDRRSAP